MIQQTSSRLSAYECGRLARRQNCYRILYNPENKQEEIDWLRGWDEQDAELKNKTE